MTSEPDCWRDRAERAEAEVERNKSKFFELQEAYINMVDNFEDEAAHWKARAEWAETQLEEKTVTTPDIEELAEKWRTEKFRAEMAEDRVRKLKVVIEGLENLLDRSEEAGRERRNGTDN